MKIKVIYIALLMLILVSVSFTNNEKETKTFKNDNIKCTYQTIENNLNGLYVSYYLNGQKKTEGYFENGYRTGVWSVWDENGNLKLTKSYSDPFTFKQIYPKVSTDKSIQLLHKPQYKITYNNEGFIEYFNVEEVDVVYHKRIWSFLPIEKNDLLAEENDLLKLLQQLIFKKLISSYTDDSFWKKDSSLINLSKFQLIGFNLKEDFFFDKNRMVSEFRTIGICPVVINKETNDTIDLYWVYFPYIRKYLAQESLQNKNLPEKIKTLDDLFFYRFFNKNHYQSSSVLGDVKANKNYFSHNPAIIIDLIEKENDVWINLAPLPTK